MSIILLLGVAFFTLLGMKLLYDSVMEARNTPSQTLESADGIPLEGSIDVTHVICSHCGHEQAPEYRYCENCVNRLYA